jgi:hypothetical protein
MSTSTQVDAGAPRGHLSCPRCGLSIEVRRCRTAIRHCPRCVVRSRVIVELFSSALPADVLYDESSLPGVVDELALARTSISAGSHQQGQVGEKLRASAASRACRQMSGGDPHPPPSASEPRHPPYRGHYWPPARPASSQGGQGAGSKCFGRQCVSTRSHRVHAIEPDHMSAHARRHRHPRRRAVVRQGPSAYRRRRP